MHRRSPGLVFRFARSLARRSWYLLGALSLGAAILGYFGFRMEFTRDGKEGSFLDLLYLSLQLFTLESGARAGEVRWPLEVARLLAPILAASAAVKGLAVLFREQFDLMRARWARGHVIVCGLGEKGARIAENFLEAGGRVVAVEVDPQSHNRGSVQEDGAIVVTGDASDPDVLRRAGVKRARLLVATCGDEGVNAEVALQASTLADGRDAPLTCLVHVVEPRLCELLRRQQLEESPASGSRLEFFNVFESGARELLRVFPPFGGAVAEPHVVLVGLGRLGEAVLIQAARLWKASRGSAGRLVVTVVDREAPSKLDALTARFPGLSAVWNLVPVALEPRTPEFERAAFLEAGDRPPSLVYVALGSDWASLSAALALHERGRALGLPIVAVTNREGGLAALLPSYGAGGPAPGGLHAFGLLDRTCTADLLLGGTNETLARAIHAEYVADQRNQGATPAANPSMVPWDELPESLRQSNRAQADHIGVKLKEIRCRLAQLMDGHADRFELSADEIERMAELEHERWVEERTKAGWKPGRKNVEKKVSPYLVPWNKLTDDIKQLDRNTVRGLPAFLALAGFHICRLEEGLTGDRAHRRPPLLPGDCGGEKDSELRVR